VAEILCLGKKLDFRMRQCKLRENLFEYGTLASVPCEAIMMIAKETLC
jgi:hypothetical protein